MWVPTRRLRLAQFILPVLTLGILCAIAALARTQHWPNHYNPPGMDLSRRAVFTLASVLELLGAGAVGYAFGLVASNRRRAWGQTGAHHLQFSHTGIAVRVICGIILVIIAGHYEYLSLTGRLP